MSTAAEKEREVQQAELNFVDHGLTPTPIPPEKAPPPYEEAATEVEVKKKGDKQTDKDAKKVKPTNIIKLFRYSTWFDRFLILLGTLAAMAHGACLPLLWLFFGSLTNTFIQQSASVNISTTYEQLFNTSIDCNSVFDFPVMDVTVPNATITGILRSFNFSDDVECLLESNFLSAIDRDILTFVYFGIAVFLVAMSHISFFQMTAERQVYKIRLAYYRAILRQDIAWFDVNPSGELANRLSDDIDKIHAGIGDKLAILIQWVSTAITGFIVSYSQEWRLALLLTAFAPLMIIAGAAIAKATAAFTSKEQKEYASAGAVAEEVLSSIRTVFAFGGEKNETDRYNRKLKEAKRIGAKKGLTVGVVIGFIFLLLFCLYGVAFWFGGYLIQSHGAQGGNILAAFFTVIIAAFSLGQSAPNIESFLTAAGSAGSIYDTIDRVPTIDSSSTKGLKPDKFEPVIELKNVSFSYPARADVQVMHDVSLKVEVGQTVALVGPSGCGKSTVVQLIQRFYDVESGEVVVGGNNVKDWNLKWLRSHIGVVSQEPILFDATIAENIRYGKEDATMEEIEEAAKKANAHNFISSLPQGYDTSTGERGVQLSGGQKQRIAIARALLSNPKILLLDEATSALDTESEAVVQEALDVAREGRTTIVIAHRLSTIQNADVICAINEGRVVEVGSHSDLMTQKGLYYELVNAQSFGTDENFIQTGQVGRLLSQRSIQRSVKGSSSGPGGFERQLSLRRQASAFSDDGGKKKLKQEISVKQQEAWDKDIPAVPLHRILALNGKEWWLITLGVFGAGINGLVFPSFSIFFGEILRVFGLRPDMVLAAVHMWGALFIGLGFVSGIANFVKVFCFTLSGENLTARLRSLSFKAMLRQEISWFDDDRNSTGALITRLADDAGQVQGATGTRVGGLIETFFGLGFSILVAFVYSWLITLVILGTVPILLIAGGLQFKVLHGNAAKNKKNVETAGKIAVDSIDNIRTVASLTIEENFFEQYKVQIKGPYLRSILINPFVYGLIYGFTQGVLFFMFAIVFRFGAFLVNLPPDHSLHVEYENVFRVFIAITFGAISIGQASAFAPNYAKAKLSANRIFALLDRVPLIDNYSEDGEKLENIQGTIAVKDVRFTYPARADIEVLQGMNLELQPGKTLALVGPSGCGKSTVVSLIERFYDPSAGSLTLEGVDLRDLNLNWLRSQIGIVSQEPVLFDCSIAENIRYGALFREVSDEEVIEAAKSANIHNFIESLPEGYNTKVGSKGTQLSGGQKQRVAISRALVRDPKVLLLDEATSALDTESEKIVQEALDKAREGRTSIVIAHRLSTVYNSDCIAVIQGGKVLERGTHSELLSMKGLYYKLNRFQMIESEEGGDSVF